MPVVRDMGNVTEGLQKMREGIHAHKQGVEIPIQVRWMANPHNIRDGCQRGEISASSVVFLVKWNKLVRKLIREGIKAVGVWYRVEPFTNIGPDSRCKHCAGWGHIKCKCSSKSVCPYCSGPHHTSNHKCNVVGCTAKQGSICGHTQEKCTNCKGSHIGFSSR